MSVTLASGVSQPEGHGLSGAGPAAVKSNVVHRSSDMRSLFAAGRVPISPDEVSAERVDVLAAKSTTTLDGGDFLVTVVNGGGGFGDPLRRDPAAVARDVADGLISPAAARDVYGVVVGDATGTEARRAEIRAQRLREGSGGGPVDRVDGGEVLHQVSDTVEAVALDGARWLRCTACRHRFGAYDADHKRACSMRELPITAHSELNALGLVDAFVLREFSCPGCGTAVAVDVQRREEPILDESRLAP